MTLALQTTILASGCGDDDDDDDGSDAPATADGPRSDAAGGSDGANPDAAEGDAAPETPFDMPTDFDPLGCAPGSLAALEADGVWHLDMRGGFFDLPMGVRIDGALALIEGSPADTVQIDDDYVFLRNQFDFPGGSYVRAVSACALNDDGTLYGKWALCVTPMCFNGTFTGHRVERIPGEAEIMGMAVAGEWNGDPAVPWDPGLTTNVRVANDVAYLSRGYDGLRVISVADPAAMADLGHVPVERLDEGEFYNDVKLVGRADGRRYALMASSERGLVVIDVTDPAAPAEVAAWPPLMPDERLGVHTLFTETRGGQTRAYLANTDTFALDVWDVTDPTAATLLGSFTHPDVESDPAAYLHDLYIEDGVAYLNYWSLGLVVVDMNDPTAPVLAGEFDDYEPRASHSNWVTTAGGRKISVMGDEGWNAHIHIVDVDPASPAFLTRIGELSLRAPVSVHNIMAFGDKAYVTWYQDGVRLIDLSDPTNPQIVAYAQTWSPFEGQGNFFEGAIGIDVDLASGLIYVADTNRGLILFREEE